MEARRLLDALPLAPLAGHFCTSANGFFECYVSLGQGRSLKIDAHEKTVQIQAHMPGSLPVLLLRQSALEEEELKWEREGRWMKIVEDFVKFAEEASRAETQRTEKRLADNRAGLLEQCAKNF